MPKEGGLVTERIDAEPLPLLDRYELVKTAIDMIDDGIDVLTADALEDGLEITPEFLEGMEDMRADAYIAMLHSMVNNHRETVEMLALLRADSKVGE